MHLFSHQHRGLDPRDNARALWPTLATGVASTCVAYLAFLFSGVRGLAQLSVFTVVGLAVAGLTTRFLLPPLVPAQRPDAAASERLARLWDRIAACRVRRGSACWWLAVRRRARAFAAPAVAGRARWPDPRAPCADRARFGAAARTGRARRAVPAGHPGRRRARACWDERRRSTRSSKSWCAWSPGGLRSRGALPADRRAAAAAACRPAGPPAAAGSARGSARHDAVPARCRSRRSSPMSSARASCRRSARRTSRARRSRPASADCCSSATVTGRGSSR